MTDPLKTTEQALSLAQLMLQLHGYVVVLYRNNVPMQIGQRTSFLWKYFETSYVFIPVREASIDEWENQREAFFELFKVKPKREQTGRLLVLVTDQPHRKEKMGRKAITNDERMESYLEEASEESLKRFIDLASFTVRRLERLRVKAEEAQKSLPGVE